MAKLPGLLKFAPHYRTVRWGGQRIAQFKNIRPCGEHIGESWELSALPDMLTPVSEGPLKGATIPQLTCITMCERTLKPYFFVLIRNDMSQ